jgi:hypothetical protein
MEMVPTGQQWAELDAAPRMETRLRVWKRLQAVRLVADGHAPTTVAQALRDCLASV